MAELPGFVGPSYTLPSKNASCQRSLNLYPEQNELAPSKWCLKRTPGLVLLSQAGTAHRGAFRSYTGRSFCVSGEGLYEITDPANPALLATLYTSSGRVQMAENVNHLVIVDGSYGYALRFVDSTFQVISNENFPKCSSVAFIDQYILVNDENTGRFQYSALNDATSWDGLDMASAEGSPDNIVALAVDHREITLFGDQTTEFWFDSGDADNAFARREGAFLEIGIAGKHLHAMVDNVRYFWGKNADGSAMAYRIVGYQAQRVSTYAIESAVAKYGDLSGGSCWAYQEDGHTFWATNFPGAKVTWVFDVATGMWHERSYRNPVSGAEERNRVEWHLYHNGKHIVGDYANGNIYEMKGYADNGNPLVWKRVWPGVKIENKKIFYNKLELDMETGVGLDGNVQGSDPQVMLRCSDDAGKNWGVERVKSMGKIGETSARVKWTRLGSSRDRVFEVSGSDPVSVTMMAAWVDAEAGLH